MRQILQNLKSGETLVAELPCPRVKPGQLLIRSRVSLVSVGTERMFVDFGRANLVDKARQQPDKVKKVLDKVKTDGLFPTLDAVRTKLDQAMPLGYANAGVVIEVGEGVPGFAVGDRVVSNGPHAEVVRVPHRLCAKIPDDVDFETAAFTVIGSIGLQGIRLVQPTLGEWIGVTGLGLIGLLCVQMLRASGCNVLGIDLDASRCELARKLGASVVNVGAGEDPEQVAAAVTDGAGLDAVLITAATRSDVPMAQAAHMCRKRGRIVLIGTTGLNLSRSDFYKKELSFQVSCSYGPGRYDPGYEVEGNDYPAAFVRWTEQRNFGAVLGLMKSGQVQTASLITHRTPIAEAATVYGAIADGESVLGAVLQYPVEEPDQLRAATINLDSGARGRARGRGTVGLIGAGNFAGAVLAPELARVGANLHTIASSSGVSGSQLGRKFGFAHSTTDAGTIFTESAIDTVVVSTRHGTHASMVTRALEAGQAVFVEKPLALTLDELSSVEAAYRAADSPLLMVGFNRRFSPHAVKMAELLRPLRAPKCLVMTVNAGFIPGESWVHDPADGGGRIRGEGCHWIDLLRFVVGAPITSWQAVCIGAAPGVAIRDDKATVTLCFADGSIGTLHYFGNGAKAFPKERLDVFVANKVLTLDNFTELRGWGWDSFKRMKLRRQDKGHRAEVAAFMEAVRTGGPAPIPFDEILEVSRVTLEVAAALDEPSA